MSNKVIMSIMLVCFWVFMPVFLMALNVSGYSSISTETKDELRQISSSDFNILTLDGFGTAMGFFISLGKFTITNMNIWVNTFLFFLFLVSMLLLFFFARGGGS